MTMLPKTLLCCASVLLMAPAPHSIRTVSTTPEMPVIPQAGLLAKTENLVLARRAVGELEV